MNDAETEKELQKAKENLMKIWGRVVIDPFYEEMNQQLSEEYLKILNKITVELAPLLFQKIQLKLPVYHGTGGKVLKRRRTYSEYCISCGRRRNPCGSRIALRGLPEARLFTDLDKLEKGRYVFIRVLDETLAYEVDQIKTVLPEDTGDLQPSKEQDYVTLVTCTPLWR